MSALRRRLLFAIALVGTASCRTPPFSLEAEPVVDARDAQSAGDLGRTPDLVLLSDLAQPDLVPPDDCPLESKLVYVIDRRSNVLSSFRPDTLVFRDIAALDCSAPSGYTPDSMAVQRDGTGWVAWISAAFDQPLLYRVDVRTGKCDPTPHAPVGGLPGAFGMAIALDDGPQQTMVETLYVAGASQTGSPAQELGTLDRVRFQYAARGALDGEGDLTADSDGHLYALFPDWNRITTRVEDLDKTSGSSLHTWRLPQLDAYQGSVAVAAWGKALWIFLESAQGGSTAVFRFDPLTGLVTTAIPSTGRHVVGAGVAPCR